MIKKIVFALVALGAVSFALIGFLECAFVAYYGATDKLVSRPLDSGMGIRSWTTHHAMRPAYEGPGDPRGLPHVVTNSLGLRDEEPVLPKPEGVYRILFLGDSYTYGWKVTREESFVRVCGAMLGHSGGLEVEVVNGGVASYSPMLGFLSYRHHLHVVEPDLVVVQVDMSDVQDTHWLMPHVVRDADGVPLVCSEPSLVEPARDTPSLLSWRWLQRRFASAAADPLAEDNPGIGNGARGRYLWTLDDGPTWEAEAADMLEPIRHLQDMLRPRGIGLVMATYPYPWQVSATALGPRLREQLMVGDVVHRNDRPFRMMAAFADEHDLPFANALDTFRAHPDPDSLYLPDDPHWTPAGQRLYGEFLARELSKMVEALQLR